MKRIVRNEKLTSDESAKLNIIRNRVANELPSLIESHQQRMSSKNHLQELMIELKSAREAKGLSLSDLTELTGMDQSALSKLETGQRPNPTMETLLRYADAVGKRLVVSLADVFPAS